jgi:hypothetical protein
MGIHLALPLAYISASLVFLAPLLVTLALKVNSLVGIEQAPDSLALVTGIGAVLAMVRNPLTTVLVSGIGERYTPDVAALLLGAWAVGALAVGIIALNRRDP